MENCSICNRCALWEPCGNVSTFIAITMNYLSFNVKLNASIESKWSVLGFLKTDQIFSMKGFHVKNISKWNTFSSILRFHGFPLLFVIQSFVLFISPSDWRKTEYQSILRFVWEKYVSWKPNNTCSSEMRKISSIVGG